MQNQHSQVPAAMDKNLEQILFRKDGGMYLAASAMNTRYWKGTLWFYSNPDSAPDPGLSTAGVDVGCGLTDIDCIDEDTVLVSTDAGTLDIWKLEDEDQRFEHIMTSQVHDTIVSSVSVNARRNSAVSCDYDGWVKLWDLTTLQVMHQYRAHTDIALNVCYHPEDSSLFTSCSQDGRTLLWDTRKTRPAKVIESSYISQPTCTKWSYGADQRLAVGSECGAIEFKDLRNLSESPCVVTPHQRVVHRMAFCPGSDNLLASVSEDCTVSITHLQGSDSKQVYQDVFTDFVHGLAWKNSSQLYTCSWDQKVKCHDISALSNSVAMETGDSLASYADKLKNKSNISENAH